MENYAEQETRVEAIRLSLTGWKGCGARDSAIRIRRKDPET